MKILNYGTGAVGLGISSCLLKAGHSVDFIARQETALALKQKGLKRRGIFGDFTVAPQELRAYVSLGQIPQIQYDFILVSIKSFDSAFAAQDLSKYPRLFHKETKIVLFQNGWGNAEIFLQYFPQDRIYSARVITGFSRPQPNEVIITVHAEAIRLGSLFESDLKSMRVLSEAIRKGDIPCETTPDISKDLWAKMLYNCALNPLGAILGVPYGTLGDNEQTRVIMNNIIEEIFSVMKACDYKTHWASPEDYQNIFYSKLIPATKEHRSSTLQSLKNKKRTEIDALNGIIVQLADNRHLAVPANQTIYNLIKFIEQKA